MKHRLIEELDKKQKTETDEEKCPNCDSQEWDGFDCFDCGFESSCWDNGDFYK